MSEPLTEEERDGGDRPMSPAVSKLRRLWDLEQRERSAQRGDRPEEMTDGS